MLGASGGISGTGTAIAEQLAANGQSFSYAGSAELQSGIKIDTSTVRRINVAETEKLINGVLDYFKVILEAGVNPNTVFNAIAAVKMQTLSEHSQETTNEALAQLHSREPVSQQYYAESVRGHATIHELLARLLPHAVHTTLSYDAKFPGSEQPIPTLYTPSVGKAASRALALREIYTTLTKEAQELWEGELTKFISENHELINSVLGAEWNANHDFNSPLTNLRTRSLPETQSPAANFSGIDYQIVWRFAVEIWNDHEFREHPLVTQIKHLIPNAGVIMDALFDFQAPEVTSSTTYEELMKKLIKQFLSLEIITQDGEKTDGRQLVGLIHLMAELISDYYKTAQAKILVDEKQDSEDPFRLLEPVDLLRIDLTSSARNPVLSNCSSEYQSAQKLWNGQARFPKVAAMKTGESIYQVPSAKSQEPFLKGHTYINPGMALLEHFLMLYGEISNNPEIKFTKPLYPGERFYFSLNDEKSEWSVIRYPDGTKIAEIKLQETPPGFSLEFQRAQEARKIHSEKISVDPYQSKRLFHSGIMALAHNPAEFEVQTIPTESTTKSPQLLISTEIEAPTHFGERVPATIIWEQVMQQLVSGTLEVTYPKKDTENPQTFAQLGKNPQVKSLSASTDLNINAGEGYSVELLVDKNIKMVGALNLLIGKICLTDAHGKKHYAQIKCNLQ